MERSLVPREGTARDDAARLKRLPVRRTAVRGSRSTIAGGRLGGGAIALVGPALALLTAFAPVNVVGDIARACMYVGMLVAVGTSVFILAAEDGARSPPEALALRRLTLG